MSTKIACSEHVLFRLVKPYVHDGSMGIDKRPQLRPTSHGMCSDILPPRDCECRQFFPRLQASDNGDHLRLQHRSLKDNCHENIKWDSCIKIDREARSKVTWLSRLRVRRQIAGVSPRGNLHYDSWNLSPLGYDTQRQLHVWSSLITYGVVSGYHSLVD